jgi:hypothetical protein
MKASNVFLISLTAVLSVSANTLPSLLDALRASGASAFADQITADPNITALYLSDQVHTVFAPRDEAYSYSYNGPGKRALTPAQQQALLIQCTKDQATLQSLTSLPGGTQIVTQDNSTKLNGTGQSVVSDARPKNTTNAKRDISLPLYSATWTRSAPSAITTSPFYKSTWTPSAPSWVNTTHPLYAPTWTSSHGPSSYGPSSYGPSSYEQFSYGPSSYEQFSYGPSTYTSSPYPPTPTPSPPSLVRIYSGLGNSVNVIQADIPYDGGLIQLIDG